MSFYGERRGSPEKVAGGVVPCATVGAASPLVGLPT